ncbi:peroxiredoxin family protein [Leptospira bandrabouensis]|nr:peroxiredoxin family protein [Leptospira bandrabouensis]MCG6151025.1 peroxiredoxin family protein [Leptospira bandrabouensis]MCW7457446.1 peroxiredoxin family protein [Leptospira bandrabouensis]MCW7476278.1 peroxiredoxin family protein [Leptospira bandrabouensis]MCW7483961.1 peroxiredoxin family protein [Leptospira bandrabouensis]
MEAEESINLILREKLEHPKTKKNRIKTQKIFALAVNGFMNRLKSVSRFVIFLLAVVFISQEKWEAQPMPQFQMKDQYGQSYSDSSVKGKPVVLMGCFLRDLELCRKQGRKLYWKMQNLLWKDSSKVHFLLYLDFQETNKLVENYLEESKTKQYESILLDRKGHLTVGLTKGESYLRIFNKSGKLISSSYQEEMDENLIQEIYGILKKEI